MSSPLLSKVWQHRNLHLAVAIALGLTVILSTFRDYGISWDEAVQTRYGELTLSYFTTLFADKRATSFMDTRFYGPLFELLSALLTLLAPAYKYDIHHLLSALAGLVGVVGVMLYGRLLLHPYAGAFAALALVLSPRFYGYAFVNSKDVPLAACVVWTFYMLVRFMGEPDRWTRALLFGLTLGLALAVRPGAMPILIALALCVSIFRGLTTRLPRKFYYLAPVALLLAWVIMVAAWPWAHQNPFTHPFLAVKAAISFPNVYEVFYLGEKYSSDALPWYYLPHFFLITTPLVVLTAGIAGAIVVAVSMVRRSGNPTSVAGFAVVMWFFAPLASVIILQPSLYGGMRHFLFIVPALCLLAGIALSYLVQSLKQLRLRFAAAACCAGLLVLPVVAVVSLHPYQLSYFNLLVGGVAGASSRYEADSWLTSYRSAVEWVNDQPRGADKIRLLVAANGPASFCASEYLADHVEMTRMFSRDRSGEIPSKFDYYIGSSKFRFDLNFPDSPVVHTEGRAGAVFSVVRKR
jgi:4-amino-4-deoxy-L-arabinose transferase-like glycosyltransferase